MKNPFLRRLVLSVAIANILVVFMAAEMLYRSHLGDEEHAQLAARNLSRSLAHGVSHLISEVDLSLVAIAAEFERQQEGRVDRQGLKTFVSRLHERIPQVTDLRIIDANGIEFGPQAGATPPSGTVGAEYFQWLRDHPKVDMAVFPPRREGVDGAWVMIIAHRLTHRGEAYGGVIASVDMEHIRHMLTQLDVGANGVVTLLDGNFTVFVRHSGAGNDDRAVGQSFHSNQFVQQMRAQGDGGLVEAPSPIDGIPRLYAYDKIGAQPLYAFVGLSKQDYLARWNREVLRTLLLVLSFFLVSLIGGRLIYRAWLARHQDEERIKKLSWVVEQSQSSILITDPQGVIEYVNPEFSRATGYSQAEVIGQTPRILKSGITSPAEYAEIWAALKHGQTCRVEFLNRRKDGSTFWEDAVLSAVTDDAGKIVNYVSVKVDISERKKLERELQENLQRFSDLANGGRALIWTSGLDKRCDYFNQPWLAFTGRTLEQELGDGWLEGVHPEDVAPCLNGYVAAFERQEKFSLIYRLRRHDGEYRWILDEGTPRQDHEGRFIGYIGHCMDITDLRLAEDKLRLADLVLRNINEALLVTDANANILSVNPAFEGMTGYGLDEVAGCNPRLLSAGKNDPAFYRDMWSAVLEAGHWQGEIWNRRKNGEEFPALLNISAIRNPAGLTSHYVGVLADISEQKSAEDRIQFLAYHDPLTNMPNRLLLRDRFEQARAFSSRSSRRLALLVLDIDNFKTINDSLGHPIGDGLLKALAQRLGDGVRDTDTVGRLGGDEFLVILSEIDNADVVATAVRKLLVAVEDPVKVDGHELFVSASVGIAMYPDDGDEFDTLLKRADTAMYQAKEAGRNTHRFFAAEMNRAAEKHLEMRGELARALQFEEFLLHYQPQVDATTHRILGVEALVRWQHPRRGLVSPGEFIPVAEATGQIVPMGEWVLREACRQAMQWEKEGLPSITVAVNLSAVQFRRGQLDELVALALKESGLPPHRLELELTESILLSDDLALAETLKKFKAMGVRISIDDFGTGYSNLTYLKRFSIDKLKIDQSFVRNISLSPDDMAIVQSIVLLARRLRISTIAEGVETQRQMDYLRIANCREIQGYFTGRPMPASELARRLVVEKGVETNPA